jgi:CheY-like chemotaxis protein
MRILIADDNDNHRSDMVDIVQEVARGLARSAEIMDVGAYASAVEMARSGPDLLIVDARLSGDDPGLVWEGYRVADVARAANPRVQVLLLSAAFRGVPAPTSRDRGNILLEKNRSDWLDQLEQILRVVLPRAGRQTVFVSYARSDSGTVVRVYRELIRAGFAPWWDQDDLLPGQDWKFAIEARVRGSDFFLACIGRTYSDREGGIQRELRWAVDRASELPKGRTYLIPARLTADCQIPPDLEGYQRVDLFEVDGMARLLRALNGD